MKCPICGKESEGNERFCTECGAKLEPSAEPKPPEKTEPVVKPEQPPAAPAAPKPVPAPYVNTAAAGTKPVKEKVKRDMSPCKPLSTWSFVWRSLLFMIPVIGIIFMFVFAYSKGINENSKSHARSWLIFLLIAVIIMIAGGVLCYIFREPVLEWIRTFLRNFLSE